MCKRIICIGGGEIKSKTTIEIDRYIANLAKKHAGEKRAYGLFIGTASHDFMPYFNSFRKMYTGEFDIKADCALLLYDKMDISKIEEKFLKADFIYIGGGDTVFMLDTWKKCGVDKMLLDAYNRGVIICGLSAGAICYFETMYTDSQISGSADKYNFYNGLGWLSGVCSPHYDDRIDDFHANILQNNIENAIGIENNSAIVYEDGKLIGSLSSGGKSYLIRNNLGVIERYQIKEINL